ncbi:Protein of unknown function [Leuconostoc citreum LBAE C10]|nr:Protein of unknown function [Leuconostoc citreum LBAE C10]
MRPIFNAMNQWFDENI